MYRPNKPNKTTIRINTSVEGQTIEERVQLMLNNKEPLTDSSPLIYTERKDGVKLEHDIRTDRFDAAIEAKDKLAGAYRARREERNKPKTLGEQAKDGMGKEGGTQSVASTEK